MYEIEDSIVAASFKLRSCKVKVNFGSNGVKVSERSSSVQFFSEVHGEFVERLDHATLG